MENDNKSPSNRTFLIATLILAALTFLLQFVIWHRVAGFSVIVFNSALTCLIAIGCTLALASMAIAPRIYKSVGKRNPEKQKSMRHYTLIAYCALYVVCLVIMILAAYT